MKKKKWEKSTHTKPEPITKTESFISVIFRLFIELTLDEMVSARDNKMSISVGLFSISLSYILLTTINVRGINIIY